MTGQLFSYNSQGAACHIYASILAAVSKYGVVFCEQMHEWKDGRAWTLTHYHRGPNEMFRSHLDLQYEIEIIPKWSKNWKSIWN